MICIPVIDKNITDALKNAENALKVADIVEFRVDMLEKVEEEDIVKMSNYPCIVTIRADWEGGFWNKEDDKRIELYKKAIESNAKYIDIELNEKRNKELVEYRDEIGSKTKIIVSYHDFEKTPDYDELVEIAEKELEIGDIAKFAVMANSKNDVLKVLNVIDQYKNRIIGIAMGEEGKLTRILGTQFGSILTFAAMEGRASAPGQVDVVKLKKIWELLE
ncbi:MAG: 3-dehydroquinate dehydratase [Methanothermococcus sp.]|jgi:3-dehydroquinate dehydratase-1|uniref:type I 3-dehydroquinate dehydratase n=1 Tax=Methanothermococcus TaxID=155862 RepID=UPI000361C583|nr:MULTISPECIES: type I 3-dehydroquinate dehydratase [Methanothermococcus]MDK2789800.1 3-dehydroquinate dehydratase [Methanothermococcus sp.]MDK2987242.1 3-dehydroquinate dehydratase [Methanothermococcus sp.]